MKKKVKHRKTKNIAEKNSQTANYRFSVNPLIKNELLQLLKETKSPPESNEESVMIWNDFDVPPDFIVGVKKLSQHMGVYLNAISKYDI
ncbi:hypothetical protein JTB14_037615 [Gonioctena quinquepunctata]|nr:hypothetical protein JTB14_037615 [Gonioctena quinquepunctata]